MINSTDSKDNIFIFDMLRIQLDSSIIANGGKEIQVDSKIKECCSQKRDSVIKSWLWDVPGFRRWRVTRMNSGNSIQVLNTVAYPEYANDQPILGVDILWFGVKRKLVAVLDFQPLIQDDQYFLKYYEELKTIRNSFNEFQSTENMNIYDSSKYFSPWVLFYNGKFDLFQSYLPDLFSQFIDCYWNLTLKSINQPGDLNPKQVKNIHIDYDVYNAERDPAHGLFKSYYGKEWSDYFVSNFLFPLALNSGK